MAKGTSLAGPIRSTSANNTLGRSGSITIAALTTLTGAVYTIADADAMVGDVISVSPNVAVEAGVVIAAAYCAVAGTVSIRIQNCSSGTLTGGALAVNYTITK
jgi:hypothetical protein